MKKLLRRVRGAIPDRWDVLGVAGVACICAGVFLLAGRSWALVFAGAVLLIVAIIGAKNALHTDRA